jgi:hypothetical protein
MNIAGAPQINLDDLSWDAISFKVPPTATEYFCQVYPRALDILSMNDFAILDSLDDTVGDIIL